jgi:hypothetical protein
MADWFAIFPQSGLLTKAEIFVFLSLASSRCQTGSVSDFMGFLLWNPVKCRQSNNLLS